MLLASALHLSTLLVDVVECSDQTNIQHGQRGQRNDQHKDGIQNVTVDDEIQPVVYQRRVDGTRDPVTAVLETTLRKFRCIVKHGEDEDHCQLTSSIRYRAEPNRLQTYTASSHSSSGPAREEWAIPACPGTTFVTRALHIFHEEKFSTENCKLVNQSC